MKHNILRVSVITALACSTAMTLLPSAEADSLFWRRRPRHTFLVEDSRARRPGDLVTIIINESTEVQNRENRALNKSSAANGVFDLAGATPTNAVSANFDASKQTGRSFSGDATYRNSREVLDHITVTVTEVTPNGNLVFAGQRDINVSDDKRRLVISGTIRPVDIGPDNTVNSRFIADMNTSFVNDKGPEKHFTRQGYAGRFMNSIWPF